MSKRIIKKSRFSGYKGMERIGREARAKLKEFKEKAETKTENAELSKGYNSADIGMKWDVSEQYAFEQLMKGAKVEMEHTQDEETATTIASQHLYKEGIEYYNELEKMEKKLKSTNKGEQQYLDKMLDSFLSFLNLNQEYTIDYVKIPMAENPEAYKLCAIINFKETGTSIALSVNEEDSSYIDIKLPDGKYFAGNTDDAANYVNQYYNKLITKIVPDKGATESDSPEQINFKNKLELINHIRALIDEKGDDVMKYSEAELQLLRTYEGMGGQATKVTEVDLGLLDQFYTPHFIIEKMWGLAFKHGFSFSGTKNILEPSCGIGRFLEYIQEDQHVVGYEVDKYAYTIAKISFPKFTIHHAPFESMFFDEKTLIKRAINPFYHLVIGNPPYRPLESKFVLMKDQIGKTEKDYTRAATFDQYMLRRGVDKLVPGGLLIFIIPNQFLSNDSSYNTFKTLLNEQAELIDAYRLPNGVFENTSIGTDIVVFKKR
jgi:hypothetical protein